MSDHHQPADTRTRCDDSQSCSWWWSAAALAAPAVAGASKLIVRNASHITLKVNAKNRAVVSYRAKGIVRHVLVWGAINAKPPERGASA